MLPYIYLVYELDIVEIHFRAATSCKVVAITRASCSKYDVVWNYTIVGTWHLLEWDVMLVPLVIRGFRFEVCSVEHAIVATIGTAGDAVHIGAEGGFVSLGTIYTPRAAPITHTAEYLCKIGITLCAYRTYIVDATAGVLNPHLHTLWL